jgi:hypothetical protein
LEAFAGIRETLRKHHPPQVQLTPDRVGNRNFSLSATALKTRNSADPSLAGIALIQARNCLLSVLGKAACVKGHGQSRQVGNYSGAGRYVVECRLRLEFGRLFVSRQCCRGCPQCSLINLRELRADRNIVYKTGSYWQQHT